MALDRRQLLRAFGAASALPVLTGAPARLAFAAGTSGLGDKRLAVVILRGGLDALTAVPPYGDSDYRHLRASIAVSPPGGPDGALDLDGQFGLHPALRGLHAMYRDGTLAVVHAAAPPYRGRSHFDGQNILENGTPVAYGRPDGWLNRALALVPGGGARLGLAVGFSVPLMIRGKTDIRTWAPTNLPPADEDFLHRLAALYGHDPLLARALSEAMTSAAGTASMDRTPDNAPGRRNAFPEMARAAGKLLATADGPRVAVLEAGGWDTHVGQVLRLGQLLPAFDQGMTALKDNLGAAWKDTVIIAVSEFGRTVAENGGHGTDHGTGGLAFLAGGAVAGGRVLGDWPGLGERALLDGRDLRPTTDYRSLFKAVLERHLGLRDSGIEDSVFPDSRAVRPAESLLKI